MANEIRARGRIPFNFVDGLKVKGVDVITITDITPTEETVGATALVGSNPNAARADHRHAMPGLVTPSAHGFMSAGDKYKLDKVSMDSAENIELFGTLSLGADSSGGPVYNYNFLQNNNAVKRYRIATLPTSTEGTYDHIRIQGIVDNGWGSHTKSAIEIFASNRNELIVQYFRGPVQNYPVHVDFFRNANGTTDIYVILDAGTFCSTSLNITEAYGSVITYSAASVSEPFGTLVFSSKNEDPLYGRLVTTSEKGLMSPSDKSKIDGIQSGAAAVTNSLPSDEDISSSASVGTATTAARADHRHAMPGLVTQTVSGFMSSSDKYKLDGITISNSDNPIVGADSLTQNGIGYVNGVDLFGQIDGALIAQAYAPNYVAQIFQDYRTGQAALRGKNGSTWTAWRYVLDSANFNSYAPTKTGVGASGTWNINVSGSASVLRPPANDGIVWPNDAFGGTGDSASIKLETAGAEDTRMVFRMTNDPGDQFAFWNASTPTAEAGTVYHNDAMTLNGNVILNAANYNNYAPTKTGVGASGTWDINISGRGFPKRSDGADLNFAFSGQGGQPPWVWGTADGNNVAVYNPSNFSVYYANSAGSVAWSNVTGKPGLVTQSVDGFMSAGDKSKLDGIQAGAQVNSVTSVAGRTGAVTLGVGDVSGAAPLASPALSGTPTAPTPDVSNNSGSLATTAYVVARVANDAPTKAGGGAYGTWSININGRGYPVRSDGQNLNFHWSGQSGQPTWLWGAGDDNNTYLYNPSNFNVNYANSAGSAGYVDWTNVGNRPTDLGSFSNGPGYAPSYSPSFTGNPTTVTAAVGDNSGTIANTAFVNTHVTNYAPTKTGGGAYGNWDISVSGSASIVDWTGVVNKPAFVGYSRWGDVTSDRASGVNYLNNSGGPIGVMVSCADTAGNTPQITILVNAVALIYDYYDSGGSYGTATPFFIVPNDAYYSVTVTDGGSIARWVELR